MLGRSLEIKVFYPLSVAYGKMFVNMGLASWNKGGKFKILSDFELFKWMKWILNKSKMTELGTFLILKKNTKISALFLPASETQYELTFNRLKTVLLSRDL